MAVLQPKHNGWELILARFARVEEQKEPAGPSSDPKEPQQGNPSGPKKASPRKRSAPKEPQQ